MSRPTALRGSLAALFCLCATSCMSGTEAIVADTPPGEWNVGVSLAYRNSDTLTFRNIGLALRHSAEVSPLEQVYFVETVSPSGVRSVESLRVTLSDAPVQAGKLRETTAPVRAGLRFGETGDYLFNVTPSGSVRGVWSVALELR